MKNIFVAFLTLLVVLLLTADPGQALSCEDAQKSLSPCLGYLTGKGGDAPPTVCCNGVNDLKTSTPTRDDRHAACECLKEAVSHFSGIRDDLAASLPKQCGVDVGFTISKDMKCDKIPKARGIAEKSSLNGISTIGNFYLGK